MKKTRQTPRNPYIPLAKRRKAGQQKSKDAKRQNGKNQQQELLREDENKTR
jgi:hypothetical protein